MDVDLLRPGTVPINPETVLWFEFLLDKELLLKHLQKHNPGQYLVILFIVAFTVIIITILFIIHILDPSPIELINKFSIAIFESSKNDAKRPELDNPETQKFPINDRVVEQHCNSKKNMALKILTLKVLAYVKWNIGLLDL